MIVAERQIQAAVRVLRSMGARRVLLFGSLVNNPGHARDVDLAVEGIPLRRILDADVAVHDIFQGPTDLVSREESPAFFAVIAGRSRVLYEEG